jgi:LysR family transcriptional regulator, low CO2-responsive transcriptional regulator
VHRALFLAPKGHPMLNLYKLDIFAAVAQAGSFSKAAERFLMSQSAVSQHVQDLEAALGAALFTRRARGVTLTPAGETLLGYTRDIFRLVSEAELAVTDVSRLASGSVTIGATPGVSAYLLPEWIDAFSDTFPSLSVSVQTDTTPNLVAKIAARELRLAIVEGELDEGAAAAVLSTDLEEAQQYVVVGRKHSWWSRAEVAMHELDRQPMVTRQRNSQTRIWSDQLLARHGVQPRIVAEFDNLESIQRAVSTRAAFTILPDYIVRDAEEKGQLKRLTVHDSDMRRSLKLVRTIEGDFSPIECAFFAQLGRRFPVITAMLPVKRRR